jgi:hypothetical protein
MTSQEIKKRVHSVFCKEERETPDMNPVRVDMSRVSVACGRQCRIGDRWLLANRQPSDFVKDCGRGKDGNTPPVVAEVGRRGSFSQWAWHDGL